MCSCTCVYTASASARTHSGLQTERDNISGLEDRERQTDRGEISARAKVKRSAMSNLTHPFMFGFVCLCVDAYVLSEAGGSLRGSAMF